MDIEFEKSIQELAGANFSEIKNFIHLLTDMIKRKNTGSAINNDLVYILFMMEKMLPDMILKNQTYYISLHANKIMERDAQFFYDRPQIFGELPKDKVNLFRDVYMDSNLSQDDKDEIWAKLQTFLIFSSIYHGKYNQQLVEKFVEELTTFFEIIKRYCKPEKKELVEKVENLVEEEQENYAPEVLIMCVANQLIPHEKMIESRDYSLFTKNNGAFLVREDIPRDWLHQVLPDKMSLEQADYVWGYLYSLLNVAKEFFPEAERLS